jgi:hypothetical protein
MSVMPMSTFLVKFRLPFACAEFERRNYPIFARRGCLISRSLVLQFGRGTMLSSVDLEIEYRVAPALRLRVCSC